MVLEDTPGNDIRQYVRGDSLSAINWKVSAKASKLMVRVPDKMEKRTLSILMNADSRPESEQDTDFLIKRDYFLEFVVSAAWLFGNQGIPVTIVYPAGTVREQLVDSRESFMEFYNTVSDGLCEPVLSGFLTILYEKEGLNEKANHLDEIKRSSDNSLTYLSFDDYLKDRKATYAILNWKVKK